MDKVFSFTLSDIAAFCGFLVALATAIGVIGKVWQWTKTPDNEQDKRISALEGTVAEHEKMLRNDNGRLKAIEDGNRVTQRALLALLDHGIDGNNVTQMEEAKVALQNHLIER